MTKHDIFFQVLKTFNLPIPTPEYKFCPARKLRADYCFIEEKLILEQEGGIFPFMRTRKDGTKYKVQGAHGSVTGILHDIEKYNEAAALGYKVIRVRPDELLTTKTMDLLRRCFQNGNN